MIWYRVAQAIREHIRQQILAGASKKSIREKFIREIDMVLDWYGDEVEK